jgi:hypothetical protein
VACAQGERQIRDLEARIVLAPTEMNEFSTGVGQKALQVEAIRRDELEQHVRHLSVEVAELRRTLMSRATVERGIEVFEPIWTNLSPTERAKLLAAVVSRVDFDGGAGEITIVMHDAGSQAIRLGEVA